MTSARRERLLAVVVVLAGAGLVLLAATRDWVTQQVTGVPGVVRLSAPGSQAAPAVAALAVVAARRRDHRCCSPAGSSPGSPESSRRSPAPVSSRR